MTPEADALIRALRDLIEAVSIAEHSIGDVETAGFARFVNPSRWFHALRTPLREAREAAAAVLDRPAPPPEANPAFNLADVKARVQRWQTTAYDTERCVEEIERLRSELAASRPAPAPDSGVD